MNAGMLCLCPYYVVHKPDQKKRSIYLVYQVMPIHIGRRWTNALRCTHYYVSDLNAYSMTIALYEEESLIDDDTALRSQVY